MSQSCDDQFEWFKDQLDIAPVDDWVIVVGHHPAGEIDVHDFVTPMQARGVSLYLNGHMHTLAHYSVNGKVMRNTLNAPISLCGILSFTVLFLNGVLSRPDWVRHDRCSCNGEG